MIAARPLGSKVSVASDGRSLLTSPKALAKSESRESNWLARAHGAGNELEDPINELQ